jgi:putative CocE/NonD family hydrolase
MKVYRLSVLLALTAAAVLPREESFSVKAHYTKSEMQLPMRDGAKLYTVVYTPKDGGPYPILLTRTPYGCTPYGPNEFPDFIGPLKFAEEKFIFVRQDVRGRFMSEGEFTDVRPIKAELKGNDTDESTDAFDTIKWLVEKLPNNNGKVGLMGTSYNGFYTNSGLVRSHPALVAASPQAPMADLFMGDDAYHNGAFFLVSNFSFYTGFPKQKNPEVPKKEEPFDYGTKEGYKFYLQMGSLANSDEAYLLGKNSYWTDLYTHATYDDFWRRRNILPFLNTVSPAVLVVGGWYDAEDLSGTLKTFKAINQKSPGTDNRLIMGPWSHGAWNRGKGDKLGDIEFGSETADFFREVELRFFRWKLKGVPEPGLPKALVFQTGRNEWKQMAQWPPPGTPRRLYMQSQGRLTFRQPDDASGFDEYVSDPANPVPFFVKPTLEMDPEYMDADQRFLDGRKDVLSYVSEPLTDDLVMAGPVTPNLYVSTTGSDSDFDVKVIDLYPAGEGKLGGYKQLIRGEPFRGKFRNSFEKPESFRPGVVQGIRFAMPDVYHCFQKGHRVMIQVQSSWFPLTDRNPQTFTDIPKAKPEQFVKATERVYRSRRNASFIEFNVEARQATPGAGPNSR